MASQKRAMCGICVADQSVYSSCGGQVLRDDAARLDRVRDQALLAVALLDGDGRAAEDALDVAALELPGEAVVGAELLVEDRGAVLERLLRVDHGAGSGSYSTSTSSAASLACARVSARTTATPSPW